MIPEIFAVAEFMAAQLGDCSGDMETTYMALRVRISVQRLRSTGPWMLTLLLKWKNSLSLSACACMKYYASYSEHSYTLSSDQSNLLITVFFSDCDQQ